MKAIMISDKPKWVAKILKGEKTIEIRKTMPKCDLPIDVYIYCTKTKILGNIIKVGSQENSDLVGKNTITGINKGFMRKGDIDLQGKVVAKFTLNKMEEIKTRQDRYKEFAFYETALDMSDLLKKSCLDYNELDNYLQGEKGTAIHISDLVIFDRPKELNEFRYAICPQTNCEYCKYNKTVEGDLYCTRKTLTKSPQNFCYVEVEE